MPNQYIVDYLKKNKDKFSVEVLREKLLKAGYPVNQIGEVVQFVYRITPPPAPKEISKIPAFWDFWHKKTYVSGKEKILDFITGFILIIVLGLIIQGLGYMMGISPFYFRSLSAFLSLLAFNFILYLALIVYFLIKRKYIAFGMICIILLPLLLLAFYLLMFLL